jgi:hypothetical protein
MNVGEDDAAAGPHDAHQPADRGMQFGEVVRASAQTTRSTLLSSSGRRREVADVNIGCRQLRARLIED